MNTISTISTRKSPSNSDNCQNSDGEPIHGGLRISLPALLFMEGLERGGIVALHHSTLGEENTGMVGIFVNNDAITISSGNGHYHSIHKLCPSKTTIVHGSGSVWVDIGSLRGILKAAKIDSRHTIHLEICEENQTAGQAIMKIALCEDGKVISTSDLPTSITSPSGILPDSVHTDDLGDTNRNGSGGITLLSASVFNLKAILKDILSVTSQRKAEFAVGMYFNQGTALIMVADDGGYIFREIKPSEYTELGERQHLVVMRFHAVQMLKVLLSTFGKNGRSGKGYPFASITLPAKDRKHIVFKCGNTTVTMRAGINSRVSQTEEINHYLQHSHEDMLASFSVDAKHLTRWCGMAKALKAKPPSFSLHHDQEAKGNNKETEIEYFLKVEGVAGNAPLEMTMPCQDVQLATTDSFRASLPTIVDSFSRMVKKGMVTFTCLSFGEERMLIQMRSPLKGDIVAVCTL